MKNNTSVYPPLSCSSEELQLSEVEQKIIESVRGLRFGVVEVTIHEGRVVQIERREKMRVR